MAPITGVISSALKYVRQRLFWIALGIIYMLHGRRVVVTGQEELHGQFGTILANTETEKVL